MYARERGDKKGFGGNLGGHMTNIRSVFVSETPFPSPKNVSFILEEYPLPPEPR